MAEIQVTTQPVTDEEVTALFDAIFRDEWPVDAVRIAATVRGLRNHIERWSVLSGGSDPHLHRPDGSAAGGWADDCEECGYDWPCPTAVVNGIIGQ